MTLDIFAIALIALMTSVALLIRLRVGARARPAGRDDAIYRPDRHDPVRMTLPLTGLSDPGGLTPPGAYLPSEMEALLKAKGAEAQDPARAPLLTGLGHQPPGDAHPHNTPETLTGRIFQLGAILLGLVFLLFWLIGIF
ncbi:MAG TPA: hypothetical protein G4O05_08370 [Caldilineae bacterium]|nr:hypothetical protein [Caldilineae bacterium]